MSRSETSPTQSPAPATAPVITTAPRPTIATAPRSTASAAPRHPAAPGADAGASAGASAAAPDAPDPESEAALRERLRACYVATYCAQRRGEPRRVLALYREFGFDGLDAWREAWDDAAKDPGWLEAVTQAALRACP